MSESKPIESMTLTEARDEVKKCDQEIQSIKAALRGIGTDSSQQNSLEIQFTKVEGLPDAAKPTLLLQLSSPIEEKEVALDSDSDDESKPSTATFSGVETSMATLSIDAKDADIPLGSCRSPVEVAPLCTLEDPKQPKDEYTKEITVDIAAAAAGAPESNEKAEDEEETPKAAAAEESAVICTVTLKVTYKPSPKDVREELYDQLNKTSQTKAQALVVLRKLSIERAKANASDASSAMTTKSAVKSGFLNKGAAPPKEEETGFLASVKQWYGRITSPDSILMKTAFWGVVTKDFWIFFGAVGFMHYRGNVLSLPPPV